MTNYLKMAMFNYPETIPVFMGFYKPTWERFGEELEKLVLAHPNIFPDYKKDDYKNPPPLIWQYELGEHTDHWGCKWNNVIEGHDSICIDYPVKKPEDVYTLKLPEKDVPLEHGLMFLRLTYLRGFENCMMDFYDESPEFYALVDKVLEYNMKMIHKVLSEMGPDDKQISFGDDLGMQNSLPTGPERWRKILKPCFEKMFAPCKKAGKIVFLHTDGCIYEIIPDLNDCGVDIINPQFRANGLDNLVDVCRGKGRNRIAVHLDLDRQLFPFATPSELEDHVLLATETLGLKEGGLALYAEVSEDVPFENIEALLKALEKARIHFS